MDRPLLLTIDDLQWCDEATLSWVSWLTNYARVLPLLVVGTAREEALGPAPAEALLHLTAAETGDPTPGSHPCP